MLIQIKHKGTDEVLHEFDCKDNTIAITLKNGIKNNADLSWADLRRADLRGADLREADLRGANLRWADLREADLRRADLRGTDLCWADLREADLRWADLHEANLRWADLREANLPKLDIIINDRYFIHVRPDIITIGCEAHEPAWWKKLTIEGAEDIDMGAGEWWKQWKPVVLAVWEAIRERKGLAHATNLQNNHN